MKRTIAYPLIALLILSLIACGVLFMDRQSLKIRLQSAEEQMIAAQEEVGVLLSEKEQWTQEKKAVGKTIGAVKTVLIDTLKELDEVTDVFKAGPAETPTATEAPLALTPKPTQEATEKPEATALPKNSPQPKATEKAVETSTAPSTLEPTPQPQATAAPTPKK